MYFYILDMCVVDMKDFVILGLDFFKVYKCIVDFRRNLVEIGNDKIIVSFKYMIKEFVIILRVIV